VQSLSRIQSIPAQERDAALYMPLNHAPLSEAARSFVDTLASRLFAQRDGAKRSGPSTIFVRAVGALLADLLRVAQREPLWWGFRSHRVEAFSGHRVGYRVFKEAFDALAAEGLIEFVKGHQQRQVIFGSQAVSWRMATRCRPTRMLLELSEQAGLSRSDLDQHFESLAPPRARKVIHPLECRRPPVHLGSQRHKGPTIDLNLADLRTKELHDQVLDLNAFFAEQLIEGQQHRGFRRIFHEVGDQPPQWNKGGRLYSIGKDNYQLARKRDRAKMTMNGEPVVELDIAASHLTILHALCGQPFDPEQDPYEVDGLPREIVKRWVTMTLGHDKLHGAWPRKVREDLEPGLGISLNAAFPIMKTQARLIEHFPLLAAWRESSVRWYDLQYVESCAIVAAVETLAFQHQVPCLPIHDSIIIPAERANLGAEVLSEAFREAVGVYPRLKAQEANVEP
jgi:hypothetical protein